PTDQLVTNCPSTLRPLVRNLARPGRHRGVRAGHDPGAGCGRDPARAGAGPPRRSPAEVPRGSPRSPGVSSGGRVASGNSSAARGPPKRDSTRLGPGCGVVLGVMGSPAPHTAGQTIRWARLYDIGTTLLSFGRIAALRRKTVGLADIASGERVL